VRLAPGLASILVAAGTLATGCTDGVRRDCAFQGETVTIFSPEVDDDQRNLKQSLVPWEDEVCVSIQLAAHRDFEQRIDSMVDGGNPPDIAMFPQPGKVRDVADVVVPLPHDVASLVRDDVGRQWTNPVTMDAEVLAIPVKADLKSLVWYSPAAFRERGYDVPTTFDEFLGLAERMARDGNTSFCLGLGSEFATGWPLTDWIEEFLLRLEGPHVYDAWWRHEIPFNDPRVVRVAQRVYDLLARPGFVAGRLEQSVNRPFAEAGNGVLNGDCMMYRMANYQVPNWPEDISLGGPGGDVDAFYLPGSEEDPRIALAGGDYLAAFSDRPAVMATMRHIASTTFAERRARGTTGGFLSPNTNVDHGVYRESIDRRFAVMLARSHPIRFDASDLMPGAVGAGSFWRGAVEISTGERTVQDVFDEIERDWPSAAG
jgi:alpha-glucoside transport system substrate-binding protein